MVGWRYGTGVGAGGLGGVNIDSVNDLSPAEMGSLLLVTRTSRMAGGTDIGTTGRGAGGADGVLPLTLSLADDAMLVGRGGLVAVIVWSMTPCASRLVGIRVAGWAAASAFLCATVNVGGVEAMRGDEDGTAARALRWATVMVGARDSGGKLLTFSVFDGTGGAYRIVGDVSVRAWRSGAVLLALNVPGGTQGRRTVPVSSCTMYSDAAPGVGRPSCGRNWNGEAGRSLAGMGTTWASCVAPLLTAIGSTA
jgi:hypothetical protein